MRCSPSKGVGLLGIVTHLGIWHKPAPFFLCALLPRTRLSLSHGHHCKDGNIPRGGHQCSDDEQWKLFLEHQEDSACSVQKPHTKKSRIDELLHPRSDPLWQRLWLEKLQLEPLLLTSTDAHQQPTTSSEHTNTTLLRIPPAPAQLCLPGWATTAPVSQERSTHPAPPAKHYH